MMYDNNSALADINANNLFDLTTSANFLFEDDDWSNPYLNINFDSQFYDIDTFTNSFLNYSNPIFISLNVQSLLSKHESLNEFLSTMLNKGIPVCAVAVQEVWQIHVPESVNIPGFKFVCTLRTAGRGGGRWLLYKRRYLLQNFISCSVC
jgi:hypothetical protein